MGSPSAWSVRCLRPIVAGPIPCDGIASCRIKVTGHLPADTPIFLFMASALSALCFASDFLTLQSALHACTGNVGFGERERWGEGLPVDIDDLLVAVFCTRVHESGIWGHAWVVSCSCMPSLCKMMCYRIRGLLNSGTLWKCGGGYIMFGGAACLTPLFTDHESCEVLLLVMRRRPGHGLRRLRGPQGPCPASRAQARCLKEFDRSSTGRPSGSRGPPAPPRITCGMPRH